MLKIMLKLLKEKPQSESFSNKSIDNLIDLQSMPSTQAKERTLTLSCY